MDIADVPSRRVRGREAVVRSSERFHLRDKDQTLGVSRVSVIYLDASDLLIWFHHHLQVSGIQRVQVELLAALTPKADRSTAYMMTFRESGSMKLKVIPRAAAATFIRYIRSSKVTREQLDEVVARMKNMAVEVDPGEGDCYFLLGAYWGLSDTPQLLRQLARRRVRIGALIYDLIPIRNREFFDISLAKEFSYALLNISKYLSVAFTISEYVARDYAEYRREHDLPEIPIRSLPLAIERDLPTTPKPFNQRLLEKIGPSFVMQVGTIEVRKNPRYALEIWRQLLMDGVQNVPRLLYIGRIGWRISDFLAELESTNYLDGRILIISGASDADLAAMYARARFTIFPSFTEGWGLPVGESLANGVPCITSRAASLPEVGLDFADYIDPLNVRSGVEAVKRLLEGDYRDRRAKLIEQDYPLRSWTAVATEYADAIESLLPVLVEPAVKTIPLPPGRMVFLGSSAYSGARASWPDVVERSGFSEPEPWGVWAVEPEARLLFPVSIAGRARVLLKLQTTPWLGSHSLRIEDGASNVIFEGFKDEPGASFVIGLEVDPCDNWIELIIAMVGNVVPQENDSRSLYVGVISIGYASVNDLPMRQDLIEAALLGSYHIVETPTTA